MKKIITASTSALAPLDGGGIPPQDIFGPAESFTAGANPENIKELVEENKSIRPGNFLKFRGETMDTSIIVQTNSQSLVVVNRSPDGTVNIVTYNKATLKETIMPLSAGLFANLVALSGQIKKLAR